MDHSDLELMKPDQLSAVDLPRDATCRSSRRWHCVLISKPVNQPIFDEILLVECFILTDHMFTATESLSR